MADERDGELGGSERTLHVAGNLAEVFVCTELNGRLVKDKTYTKTTEVVDARLDPTLRDAMQASASKGSRSARRFSDMGTHSRTLQPSTACVALVKSTLSVSCPSGRRLPRVPAEYNLGSWQLQSKLKRGV